MSSLSLALFSSRSRTVRYGLAVGALLTAAVLRAAEADPLASWRVGVKIHPVSDTPGRHTIHSYYLTSPESPDGSKVLFYVSSTPEGEHGDLVVRDRTTGEEKVIARDIDAEDAHRAVRQQWISNGRRVSYDDVKDGQWSIHAVDIATGENRKLAVDRQCGFGRVVDDLIPLCGCHWNPHGHRDLELLNVETGEIRVALPITKVESHYAEWLKKEFKGKPTSIYEPVLSPDGKHVFVKIAAPASEGLKGNYKTEGASHRQGMIVYDLPTQTPLAFAKLWGHPAWFPDSEKILDIKSVYWNLADGGKPELIAGIPFLRGEHESVSPDGRLFVKDGKLAKMGGGTDWGVMLCNVKGNDFQIIARFDNSKGATTWRHNHPHPVFSPDGKRVYFNVNSGPFTQLMVAEIGKYTEEPKDIRSNYGGSSN